MDKTYGDNSSQSKFLFSPGDKITYQSWKATFLVCIDSATTTGKYKLLQVRQQSIGEALKVIENLGHSSTAYDAAKERLERKYGRRSRQTAIYLEELEQFRQIRPGNAGDLDKFADLLDIAIINLKETDQTHELSNGSLYIVAAQATGGNVSQVSSLDL